jgi:multidrug transporter EmrE-like cation transporter
MGDAGRRRRVIGYLYVATTITLTTYGQLIVKWQVDKAGHFPDSASGKVEFLLRLMVNPWVISVFAGAVIAAMAWMAALTHFELSRVYPFVALSFVGVLVMSALVFDESLTAFKVTGVLLIVAGLTVGSQT